MPFADKDTGMTAQELRSWMEANDYTIHGLAAALEVDPSTVKRWRAGTLEIRRVVELALVGLVGNTPALRDLGMDDDDLDVSFCDHCGELIDGMIAAGFSLPDGGEAHVHMGCIRAFKVAHPEAE